MDTYFKFDDFSGILTTFSDGSQYRLKIENAEYHFEFSAMFGPVLTDKHGKIFENQKPTSNFWKAVSLWANQGKRIDAEGWCVWERTPPVVFRRNAAGHREFVSGEPCDIWPLPMVELK